MIQKVSGPDVGNAPNGSIGIQVVAKKTKDYEHVYHTETKDVYVRKGYVYYLEDKKGYVIVIGSFTTERGKYIATRTSAFANPSYIDAVMNGSVMTDGDSYMVENSSEQIRFYYDKIRNFPVDKFEKYATTGPEFMVTGITLKNFLYKLTKYEKGGSEKMNVYLNKITGIDDAIVSMFMSKRTWTRKLEEEIREICYITTSSTTGTVFAGRAMIESSHYKKFSDWMDKLVKWGRTHITMLRFIEFSITVEGLHRAGQDDWDSHTKRFDNRIIRSSTRLASFGQNEMSDFYKDKIMPTDMALALLNINTPEKFKHEGFVYKKAVNGYIREDCEDSQDVKRGLYMLSIPSNFIFKVNLTEWAHVYKERNEDSRANPEVKQLCETIAEKLEDAVPWFTRKLFMEIKN